MLVTTVKFKTGGCNNINDSNINNNNWQLIKLFNPVSTLFKVFVEHLQCKFYTTVRHVFLLMIAIPRIGFWFCNDKAKH